MTSIDSETGLHLPQLKPQPVGRAKFYDVDDHNVTHDLSSVITAFILPRLRAYASLPLQAPLGMTDKKWGKRLDQMIEAFTLLDGSDCDLDEKQLKAIEKGLKRFAEHYVDLWY